jgi:hypothetical protein
MADLSTSTPLSANAGKMQMPQRNMRAFPRHGPYALALGMADFTCQRAAILFGLKYVRKGQAGQSKSVRDAKTRKTAA